MSRLYRLVVALIAASMLLAGCGGQTTTDAPEPTIVPAVEATDAPAGVTTDEPTAAETVPTAAARS